MTTEQIKHSLNALKRGHTGVIISHSPSQAVQENRTYLLEPGGVVENTSHQEI